MVRECLIIGAGGHARVLIDVLAGSGLTILGAVSLDHPVGAPVTAGLSVLGGDDVVATMDPVRVLLVNGVGSTRSTFTRRQIFERWSAQGFGFVEVRHSSATLGSDTECGSGIQLLAGSVVGVGSRIGNNVIVNTNASVDHDCCVGDHTHIAPGATLSGGVSVGAGTHIGAGAVVIQGIRIGDDSVIGAGAVVLDDVPDGTTVVGNPARFVR